MPRLPRARPKPKIKYRPKAEEIIEGIENRPSLSPEDIVKGKEDILNKPEFLKILESEGELIDPQLEPIEYIPNTNISIETHEGGTLQLPENIQETRPLTLKDEVIQFIQDGEFTSNNIEESELTLEGTAEEIITKTQGQYRFEDLEINKIGENANGEDIFKTLPGGKYNRTIDKITLDPQASVLDVVEEGAHSTITRIQEREPEFKGEINEWGDNLRRKWELPYSGEELFVKAYLAQRLTYMDDFEELQLDLGMPDDLIRKMDAYLGTNKEGKNLINKLFQPYKAQEVYTSDALKQKAKEDKLDYKIQHRPSSDGPPASDLLKGDMSPRDIYENPRYYIGSTPQSDPKVYSETISAMNKLKSIRGNPDAEITVYRSSPIRELNKGDWVSLSKTYAEREGRVNETQMERGMRDAPVHTYKVKANEIRWDGNSLEEWGYFPVKPKSALSPKKLIKAIKEGNTDDIIQYSLATKPSNIIKLEKFIKGMGNRFEWTQLIGQLNNAKGVPPWQINMLQLDMWGKKAGDMITKQELVDRMDKLSIRPKVSTLQNVDNEIGKWYVNSLRSDKEYWENNPNPFKFLTKKKGDIYIVNMNKVDKIIKKNMNWTDPKPFIEWQNSELRKILEALKSDVRASLSFKIKSETEAIALGYTGKNYRQPKHESYSIKKLEGYNIENYSYREDLFQVGLTSEERRLDAFLDGISRQLNNTSGKEYDDLYNFYSDLKYQLQGDEVVVEMGYFTSEFSHGHFSGYKNYIAHLRGQNLIMPPKGDKQVKAWNIDETQGDWGHQLIGARRDLLRTLTIDYANLFKVSPKEADQIVRKHFTPTNIKNIKFLQEADLPTNEKWFTGQYGEVSLQLFSKVFGEVGGFGKPPEIRDNFMDELAADFGFTVLSGADWMALDVGFYNYDLLVRNNFDKSIDPDSRTGWLNDRALTSSLLNVTNSQGQLVNLTSRGLVNMASLYPKSDARIVFPIFDPKSPLLKGKGKHVRRLNEKEVSSLPQIQPNKYTKEDGIFTKKSQMDANLKGEGALLQDRTLGSKADGTNLDKPVWFEVILPPEIMFQQRVVNAIERFHTADTPYTQLAKWIDVTLQQAVRNAIQSGSDYVTWSPAEVQMTRYHGTPVEDISNIVIRPHTEDNYHRAFVKGHHFQKIKWDFMVMKKDGTATSWTKGVGSEELGRHIGPSLVNKLINGGYDKIGFKDVDMLGAELDLSFSTYDTFHSIPGKDLIGSKDFFEQIYGGKDQKQESIISKRARALYGATSEKVPVGVKGKKENPIVVLEVGDVYRLNIMEDEFFGFNDKLIKEKGYPLLLKNFIDATLDAELGVVSSLSPISNISFNKMFHKSPEYQKLWDKTLAPLIKKTRKLLEGLDYDKKYDPQKIESIRDDFEILMERGDVSTLDLDMRGILTATKDLSYIPVLDNARIYDILGTKLIDKVDEFNIAYTKALWKWGDVGIEGEKSKYLAFQEKTEKILDIERAKWEKKNPDKGGKPIYHEGFKLSEKTKETEDEILWSLKTKNPNKPTGVNQEHMPLKKVVKQYNAFVDWFQRHFQTALYGIRKISPEAAIMLTRHDAKMLQLQTDRTVAVTPLIKWLNKLQKKDPSRYTKIDIALKNGQFDFVKAEADKDGKGSALINAIKVIDTMGQDFVDTGVLHPNQRIDNYFPRHVGDVESLKLVIGSGKAGLIEEAIAMAAKTKGRPLSEYEKSDVINNVLAGYGNYVNGGIIWNKARVIEELEPEWNQFYLSSQDALLEFVVHGTSHVEQKRFFGSGRHIDENGKEEKIYDGDSIGEYIQHLLETNSLSPKDQHKLRQLLDFRFSPAPFSAGVQSWKNIIYMVTLGNLDSGLSQLQDLGLTLYFEKGTLGLRAVPSVLRSLARNAVRYATFGKYTPNIGKRDIDKGQLGVDKIWYEHDNLNSFTGKALNTLFKINTMDFVDGIGKDSHINTVLGKCRVQARIALRDGEIPIELKNWLGRGFTEPEWDGVIKELDSGEITDNVKLLAFTILQNLHPVTKSNMPMGYDKHPFMYQLRTFALNQLNFLFQDFKDTWGASRKERNPWKKTKLKAKAVNNMGWAVALLTLAGATIQEMRDWLNGKESKFSDHVLGTLMRMFFLSRYHYWKIQEQFKIAGEKKQYGKKEENIANLVIDSVLPAGFTIPGIWLSDGVKMLKYTWEEEEDENGDKILRPNLFQRLDGVYHIPMVGHQLYWWLGKGEIKKKRNEYYRIKNDIAEIREEKNLKRKDGVQNFLDAEDAAVYSETMLYLISLGELSEDTFKTQVGDLLGETDPYYLEIKKELKIQNKLKKIEKKKKEIEEGTYDPPISTKKSKERDTDKPTKKKKKRNKKKSKRGDYHK